MNIVTSKKGYNISRIVSEIGERDFREACTSCTGGCTDYQDSEKGEVSYLYIFRGSKLTLHIYIEKECECEKLDDCCDCSENNESLEEYSLNERQYYSFFTNNLFN